MTGDITIDGIEISPEGLAILVAAVTEAISNKSNDPSQYEIAGSLQNITSLPALWESGGTFTLKRVLLSLLKGTDGREIELNVTATHIQKKYTGDAEWVNILSLETLKGLSAFQLWTQEEGNADKTYEEYKAYLRQPATDAKTEWTDTYKPDIDAGIALITELYEHPIYPGEDNYIYQWNLETHSYEKTDIYVRGDSGVEHVDNIEDASEDSQVVIVENSEPDYNWKREW